MRGRIVDFLEWKKFAINEKKSLLALASLKQKNCRQMGREGKEAQWSTFRKQFIFDFLMEFNYYSYFDTIRAFMAPKRVMNFNFNLI